MRLQGSKSDLTFVMTLLVLSLGVNVYLAIRLLRPSAPEIPLLAKGAQVTPLSVVGLDGAKATIAYEGKPTVLYVFTPSCPWCRKNVANIKQLAEARGAQYRFVGLALEEKGLAAYVEEHRFPFPVYTQVSMADRTRYGLGGIPQTLVISERGTVVENWPGAYSGDVETQIEKFFGLHLPGLATPAPPAAAEDRSPNGGAAS